MKRTAMVSLLVPVLALGALPAAAEDTIPFGAAVSLTGKTAKEGEYTRDGYNFAVFSVDHDRERRAEYREAEALQRAPHQRPQ